MEIAAIPWFRFFRRRRAIRGVEKMIRELGDLLDATNQKNLAAGLEHEIGKPGDLKLNRSPDMHDI